MSLDPERLIENRLHTPLRMEAVQTPIIPTVAQWIRETPGTLSLGQGVVSYCPPPSIFAALQTGFQDPENHKYRAVGGLPDLVQAFRKKLTIENQIHDSPGRVCMVTAGSNMGFMNAILAITDPGDEIILQTPYYFNHEMAVTLASCKPVLVSTDDDYQLRVRAIEDAIGPRTRAVVTVSPNNPTGAVYRPSDLQAVNHLCRKLGIYHIHDEAYEYFTYGSTPHFSPASLPGSEAHTISLFSLSKGFGFASWRIGFLLAPQSLSDSLMKIQDTVLICAPVVSQFAAVESLRLGKSWALEQRAPIEASRAIVQEALEKHPELCRFPRVEGAFYFLIDLPTPQSPVALAERLIREHQVAVVPGTAFGSPGCRLRISYGALTPQTAREGMKRLTRGLAALLH